MLFKQKSTANYIYKEKLVTDKELIEISSSASDKFNKMPASLIPQYNSTLNKINTKIKLAASVKSSLVIVPLSQLYGELLLLLNKANEDREVNLFNLRVILAHVYKELQGAKHLEVMFSEFNGSKTRFLNDDEILHLNLFKSMIIKINENNLKEEV
ncbi:hypothetical protein [Bacillus sp. Marseille-P3800]|uniref:hypothetical protein n=1 Tax=Bacillus sp. Marseille-P3800 TaxID=2014782 RepID=UPI000C075577|nr:hypothetical protein [Bacillus sp. Marseille-P3800]